MAEEIGFENGRNSNFQGLVTLTLTLDPAIRHTVVHHSSTSTYIPNFIEIEETFYGRTDGRTFFPPLILLGRLLEVDQIKRGPNKQQHNKKHAKIWQTAIPGLVALYDIRPGNGEGPFLQPEARTGDRQASDVHHRLMPPTLGAGT